MSEAKQHRFDETLISGYLDGELTQAQSQKVELHLQDCARCREQAEELARIREATMSTEFTLPDDRQWDETPRGGLSAFFRNFGWAVMLSWLVGFAGFGAFQLIRSPEHLLEKLLIFGFWLGFGLVFLSVLIDRLKAMGTDRYRRVEK